MSKKIQLTIPNPCHKDWDKMTPIEKGRFCGSCQRQVVDFSDMSDYEIVQFFKKPSTGSVCGRLMNDQLNRSIDIPKKHIPWIKYFFQFALPAFLVSMKANSQQRTMGKPVAVFQLRKTDKIVANQIVPVPVKQPEQLYHKLSGTVGVVDVGILLKTVEIKGKVIDEKGNPVPFATISLQDSRTATVANVDGTFSLVSDKINNSPGIVVSAVGFKEEEISLTAEQKTRDSLLVTLKLDDVMEEVVIISHTSRRWVVGEIAVPMISETRTIPLLDTLKNIFFPPKVYPNPLQKGNSFTVELKSEKEEKVELKIMTMDGRHVAAQVFPGYKGINRFTMNMDARWARGVYMVLVMNIKGDIIKTERLLIQ